MKAILVIVVFIELHLEGELQWALKHATCIQCHWTWGTSVVQSIQCHLQYQRPLMSLREAVGVPILRSTWWEETWDLFLFFWHTYKTNTCSIKNNTALLWYVSLPCVWLKNMPQFRVLCLLRYNITMLQWATSENTAGNLAPLVLKGQPFQTQHWRKTFSACNPLSSCIHSLFLWVVFFLFFFLFCYFLESCRFHLCKAVVT